MVAIHLLCYSIGFWFKTRRRSLISITPPPFSLQFIARNPPTSLFFFLFVILIVLFFLIRLHAIKIFLKNHAWNLKNIKNQWIGIDFKQMAIRIIKFFLFDHVEIEIVGCLEVQNCCRSIIYWSGVATVILTSALLTAMFFLYNIDLGCIFIAFFIAFLFEDCLKTYTWSFWKYLDIHCWKYKISCDILWMFIDLFFVVLFQVSVTSWLSFHLQVLSNIYVSFVFLCCCYLLNYIKIIAYYH